MIQRAEGAKWRLGKEKPREEILKEFDETDYHAVEVDEEILANLLKRTKIYGDCIQGENEESLREILKKTKNNVPNTILYIKAKHGEHQKFQPPTIYRNNEEAYTPPQLKIVHHKE